MMVFKYINYWAVPVAALLYNVVNMIWYSPSVLGNRWMKATGTKASDWEGRRPPYHVGLIASLVLALALAWLLEFAQIFALGELVQLTIALIVGLLAATAAPRYAFSNRPWTLYWIDLGATAASIVVMITLLYFWR